MLRRSLKNADLTTAQLRITCTDLESDIAALVVHVGYASKCMANMRFARWWLSSVVVSIVTPAPADVQHLERIQRCRARQCRRRKEPGDGPCCLVSREARPGLLFHS